MPASSRKLRVQYFPAGQTNYSTKEFQRTLEFLEDAGYICRKAAVLRESMKRTLIFKGSVRPNRKYKMLDILKAEI